MKILELEVSVGRGLGRHGERLGEFLPQDLPWELWSSSRFQNHIIPKLSPLETCCELREFQLWTSVTLAFPFDTKMG